MPELSDRYLASEVETVWLDDPAKYPFLRERVYLDQPGRGRPRDFDSARVVAYAVLDESRRDPQCARREWHFRPTDATYPAGRFPIEAAVPSSIAPGVRSRHPQD